MLQYDESRLFDASLRYAKQGAKAFLLELCEVKDFTFQPDLVCDFDRFFGEHGWGQVVRRLVAQIACEVGSARNRVTDGYAAFDQGLGRFVCYEEGDAVKRLDFVEPFCFVLIELVERESAGFGGGLCDLLWGFRVATRSRRF